MHLSCLVARSVFNPRMHTDEHRCMLGANTVGHADPRAWVSTPTNPGPRRASRLRKPAKPYRIRVHPWSARPFGAARRPVTRRVCRAIGSAPQFPACILARPMRRINIAIDGFSSCGKSTLAKQLAHHLGYTYIDSGAMYRAIALYVIENGLVVDGKLDKPDLLRVLDKIDIGFKHDDVTQRSETWLDGRNVEHRIRGMEVSKHVTLVSPVPEVRAKLVQIQQALGKDGGVVMDGRDIGTVVFPKAEVKFYMTARPEIRAQRRYLELVGRGVEIDYASVLENIERRDDDDTKREADPLLKAPDALEIDNSDLTATEQFDLALGFVVKTIGVVAEA